MEVTLSGGIEIDVATRDDIEQHHDWLKGRLGQRRAEYKELPGGVATNSNNPLLIDFGQPPAGRLWAAQWLAIFADDPFGSAIANVTACLFVGVPRYTGAGLSYSINDARMPALAVPASQNVPDSVLARGGQHIFVVLKGSGLAAGTTVGYNANLGVLVAEDSDETRAWI